MVVVVVVMEATQMGFVGRQPKLQSQVAMLSVNGEAAPLKFWAWQSEAMDRQASI